MHVDQYSNLFSYCKATEISHRYITNSHIEPLLDKLNSMFNVHVIGNSVNGLPIYGVKVGNGNTRVLMWSQMHGNESTTTKAIFDLLNAISQHYLTELIQKCTLYIVPILNPDGALKYTRENANSIDLNRDAKLLSQPESQALDSIFRSFKPDFCFNLHDQRTIYSAGNTNKSATISFLAPSQDKNRSITTTRKVAMSIIWNIYKTLSNVIPGQIGRYDDTFNINCVGDTFQSRGVPTILFEAGHYCYDYEREQTRELVFIAFITSISLIANASIDKNEATLYMSIPENKSLFYDIIIKNALIKGERNDIAFQYQEQLVDDAVVFIPKVIQIGNLSNFYAHNYIDVNSEVLTSNGNVIYEGYENDIVLINNELFSLKP